MRPQVPETETETISIINIYMEFTDTFKMKYHFFFIIQDQWAQINLRNIKILFKKVLIMNWITKKILQNYMHVNKLDLRIFNKRWKRLNIKYETWKDIYAEKNKCVAGETGISIKWLWAEEQCWISWSCRL